MDCTCSMSARISDDEVDVIVEQWQTARKNHVCVECGRNIGVGERYYFEKYFYDGFRTSKTCADFPKEDVTKFWRLPHRCKDEVMLWLKILVSVEAQKLKSSTPFEDVASQMKNRKGFSAPNIRKKYTLFCRKGWSVLVNKNCLPRGNGLESSMLKKFILRKKTGGAQ